MEKETVYIKYKFEIQYDNQKCRSRLMSQLVKEACYELSSVGQDGAYDSRRVGNGWVVKK